MKTEELSEEKLKEIKGKIREALAGTRQELLIDFPFIGNISMHMDLVPVRDKRCRTACTDGNTIFWDIDFFSSLSNDEQKFVMAHEIWHAVLLHLTRCQTRNQEVFNIASDMEVNSLLEKQNAQGIKLVSPKGLCFPPKRMEGKSAEVIYEWLMKKLRKNAKNLLNQASQQDNDNDGSGNSYDTNGNHNKKGQHKSCNSDSKSYDDVVDDDNRNDDEIPKQNGSETGKLEGQFDNHKYEGQENEDQNGNADGKAGNCSKVIDRWGEVGYDSDFTPHVNSDFADRMRERVITEAQRCQRTQGNLPAGLEGIIDKIMKPEVPWQELLKQFCTSCFGDKRRWLPPQRRGIYNEMYFQSRRNEKINVTVAIDTSGSCLGDLPKFFTELINLLKTFGGYNINLIQCDVAVDSFETYDDSKPFPVDNIKDIKWTGGGGTSFKPPFEYVRKKGIQQDCFIYFTDGYGNAPKYPPQYPVLWILTKDGNKDFCEWGKKIFFKGSSYE